MAYVVGQLTRLVKLGVIGNGPGSTLWQWGFVTADTPAVVEVANYFLADQKNLNVGDVIVASMGIGTTPKFKEYQVTVSNATTLTIVLQTATAG